MSYLQLVRREPRPLFFATSTAFFSAYGQSHFLSLFSIYLMTQLQISNTEFGTLYSGATLTSAIAIPFVGPMIDKMNVRRYSLWVGNGLLIGLCLTAIATNIWIGFAAIFLLRLNGQGLCSHIAGVSTARFFSRDRGKALSIVNSGFPLAEGIFTPLMALFIAAYDMQYALYLLIAILLLTYFPITQLSTKNHSGFNLPQPEISFSKTHTPQKSWNTKEVLLHPLFYLLIPHFLYPAFSLTGFLVYQSLFSELKHWPDNTIAIALIAFALGRFIFSFVAGPIIDRFGAVRVFPYYQIPLTLGFFLYIYTDSLFSAYIAMALFGITVGAAGPIKSSIWAELYGVAHLGAIKSMFATLAVMITAFSSFLFGYLIDQGLINQLSLGLGIASLATTFLALIAAFFIRRPA